jgi:restriction endonuclease S subunit
LIYVSLNNFFFRSFGKNIFYEKMRNGKIKYGDILIVKDGATTGKVSFVDHDFPFKKAAVNEHVFILRVDNKISSSKYVFHFLKSPKGKDEILSDFRGATVGGISRGFLDKVNVPLPPLAEQQRIAEILDKAKEIKFKRECSIEKLDSMAQSIYRRNFGNSSSIKLEEICSFQNGGTPSKEVSEYWAGDIAWISSADIVGSKIQYGRNFITTLGVENSATNIAPKGTILIVTRTGVGKVAVTDRPTAFSQDIVAITLKKGFDINFVCEALKNNLPYFLSHARGATIQGITRSVLASALIPKVDEGGQNNFGKIISAINEKNHLFIKSLGNIESLGSSLQSKAFSGQI